MSEPRFHAKCGQVTARDADGSCQPCKYVRSHAWRVDHPDQTRAIHRQYRYGITEEQWQTKLTERGGHCALCDATDNLQADHDHNTMWFRGILCSKHNRGLGLDRKSTRLNSSHA